MTTDLIFKIAVRILAVSGIVGVIFVIGLIVGLPLAGLVLRLVLASSLFGFAMLAYVAFLDFLGDKQNDKRKE